MEIRVLRYFLAVAREESITRAAEVLHITQPTLSRQLSQLEEHMGVKLLVRGTRKVTLTNEGLLLRRRAEEILELVDKTERELTEQVDLEKYDFIRLAGLERCVVTMHPDAPLVAKEYITPEDLVGVPLIMPRRANIQSEIANWFGEYYDKIQVLFTSNLPSSSAVMSNQQLAYSINTCGSVDFWDQSKLTFRPLKPELTGTCALAWKRQQPFGIAAEKFIKYARKALEMDKY